jgi:hypothetical protein
VPPPVALGLLSSNLAGYDTRVSREEQAFLWLQGFEARMYTTCDRLLCLQTLKIKGMQRVHAISRARQQCSTTLPSFAPHTHVCCWSSHPHV